jgi:hypothetical protein
MWPIASLFAAAYQAIVSGRFKKKSDLPASLPPRTALQQAGYVPEKPTAGTTVEQAEQDMRQADHYLRQGQTAQAFFQYELMRRRYAGTRYAEEAAAKASHLLER